MVRPPVAPIPPSASSPSSAIQPNQNQSQSDLLPHHHPHRRKDDQNPPKNITADHIDSPLALPTEPASEPQQTHHTHKSRRTPTVPLRIPIEPGHCLVFGRKPDLASIANEPTPKSTLVPITLPKSFTHASRTHCLCTLIAPPLGGLNIRIVVRGQNGLMVDGERFEEGSSAGVELERRDGEQIELGFYGGKKVECYVKLDEHSVQRVRPRLNFQQSIDPSNWSNSAQAPPSDPNTSLGTTLRGTKRKKTQHKANPPLSFKHPRTHSPSAPLSPSLSSHTKPSPPATESSSSQPNKLSANDQSARPASCLSPSLADPEILKLPANDRVRALIPSLGIDLLGLIASAIVFSPRATVSTTKVVRGVLETQPSLADAVLSVLPLPTSLRASPRPPAGLTSTGIEFSENLNGTSEDVKVKNEQECLSAPLPTQYHCENSIDTKPSMSELNDYYASEGEFKTDDKMDWAVKACRGVMLETLQAGWKLDGSGMFGCVTNEGLKDASGEPLEALWYYQPLKDDDLERRSNLQPFVRHVRHTQTTSKQYFFKKVRGSGRRKS